MTHTVTSTMRLLECLELLRGDPRIEFFFTRAAGTRFPEGVAQLLDRFGGHVMDWESAISPGFHLAVTAGSSGRLHQINAPLVSIPHGLAYNKVLNADEERSEGYGLASEQLMHEGAVVPSLLAISHSEQLARLKEGCPEAASRAAIVGDLSYDLMTASLLWRDVYRSALGIEAGRRLVVVNTTWGRYSLLDQHPELPLDLLRQLPADEYAVALTVHPNVSAHHGDWNLRSWLADALRAGLLLIPRDEGWHATLVASDLVVGDHGSVTLYGACLGRPVLLAGFHADSIVPGTAMARLGRCAPHLDPRLPLRPQIEAAQPPPALRDDVVENPGRAAALLRSAMYALMDLPEPRAPAPTRRVPPPKPERSAVTARLVTAWIADGAVVVERYPVSADGLTDPLLVVEDADPHPGLLELADALIRRDGGPLSGLSPADVFAAYPGCRHLLDLDGPVPVLRTRRAGMTVRGDADPTLAVAVAALLPDPPPSVVVVTGSRRSVLQLTPILR
ncbi:hypothetical protein [Actinocorallia sp. A-T 12471]|uniref:hypothetical protein n=1 Tax=Actinocorallia sp. A-T 12471 TaxID=3089813 RepID=UPI0029CD8711|nr:hypothetical protein [Actinocorallia sp. A-T 12471]MDX6740855.1 hypothetical protein [Actinocorallia sp. A-T 12471]